MNDTQLVKEALQQHLLRRNPSEERDRPYLRQRGGRSYTVNQILEEIENDTEFGRETVLMIVKLTVDLLNGKVETLDQP